MFAPGLDTRRIERVFPKGTDRGIDSYSGFYDNGHRASTGLGAWLRELGVTALTVAGVGTDYCVKFTVLDALSEGLEVEVLAAGCRGVNLQAGDAEKALEEMAAQRSIPLEVTLAVGDGANDLAMIERAGLGVAYRAKPVVAAAADAHVAHADLTALLYAQGYRETDILPDRPA